MTLVRVASFLIKKYGISVIIGNEMLAPYIELVKDKNQELVKILQSKLGDEYDSDYVLSFVKKKIIAEGLKLFDSILGTELSGVKDTFAYATGGSIHDIYEKVYHDLIHHLVNPNSYKEFEKFKNTPGYTGTLQDAAEEDMVLNVSSVWSGTLVPRYLSMVANKNITNESSPNEIVAAFTQALNSLSSEIENMKNEGLKKILRIMFHRVKTLLEQPISNSNPTEFKNKLIHEIYDIGSRTAEKHFQTTDLVAPELATKFKQFTLKYISVLNKINREIQDAW